MKSVYLAHPYPDREYGVEMRKKIEAVGLKVVNPLEKGEQMIYDEYIKTGRQIPDHIVKKLVEQDLNDIATTDGTVVLITGKPSIGASCEMFYASHSEKKPTFSLYLLETHGDIKWSKVHPWVKYLTNVSFNEEELLGKLKEFGSK